MKNILLTELLRLLRKGRKKQTDMGKLQYMLEWREKAINSYKRALDGADEEIRILSAYLVSLADRICQSGEIKIPKDEIYRGIENKRLSFRDGGDCYVISIDTDKTAEAAK